MALTWLGHFYPTMYDHQYIGVIRQYRRQIV